MGTATFTNEMLVRAWQKVAAAGGTRRDVVTEVVAELGVTDNADNRAKVYNNVTQRVKTLAARGVNFPVLNNGKRATRITTEDIAKLNAAFVVEEVKTEEQATA